MLNYETTVWVCLCGAPDHVHLALWQLGLWHACPGAVSTISIITTPAHNTDAIIMSKHSTDQDMSNFFSICLFHGTNLQLPNLAVRLAFSVDFVATHFSWNWSMDNPKCHALSNVSIYLEMTDPEIKRISKRYCADNSAFLYIHFSWLSMSYILMW